MVNKNRFYTSGAFLSDQQNTAAAPAARQPITLMMSPSMMLRKSAERLTEPQSPANNVSIRLPRNPMTLTKVLEILEFISMLFWFIPSSAFYKEFEPRRLT